MKDDFEFNIKKDRPEEIYKEVRDYFKGETLSHYATSKSIMRTQEKIAERALKLITPEKGSLILDAGSGPGFTSIYLNELGFRTVALDLLPKFLYFYKFTHINPVIGDMCYPPFRKMVFNNIISISSLQWIFRDVSNIKMRKNLINLIKTFEEIVRKKSKVIIQFYPKSDIYLKEIGNLIVRNSKFQGTFIIDNPENPKKRKIFLLIQR
ncbi:MAG: class I SAM-dependent methyltransferase [Promethearchaeota archaeon]